MLNIFKKERKFYKIETDSISGNAVFYMIGKMLSTAEATKSTNMGKNCITFLSTKTTKEILDQLEKTFGDVYNIENNGAFISMTSKMVEPL